jgi:hypothetical protein
MKSPSKVSFKSLFWSLSKPSRNAPFIQLWCWNTWKKNRKKMIIWINVLNF